MWQQKQGAARERSRGRTSTNRSISRDSRQYAHSAGALVVANQATSSAASPSQARRENTQPLALQDARQWNRPLATRNGAAKSVQSHSVPARQTLGGMMPGFKNATANARLRSSEVSGKRIPAATALVPLQSPGPNGNSPVQLAQFASPNQVPSVQYRAENALSSQLASIPPPLPFSSQNSPPAASPRPSRLSVVASAVGSVAKPAGAVAAGAVASAVTHVAKPAVSYVAQAAKSAASNAIAAAARAPQRQAWRTKTTMCCVETNCGKNGTSSVNSRPTPWKRVSSCATT